MTLDQLISKLQDVRQSHGGQVQVVARKFGDYLDSDPQLFVQERVRYSGRPGWEEKWPGDEEEEPPEQTAFVVFLEH